MTVSHRIHLCHASWADFEHPDRMEEGHRLSRTKLAITFGNYSPPTKRKRTGDGCVDTDEKLFNNWAGQLPAMINDEATKDCRLVMDDGEVIDVQGCVLANFSPKFRKVLRQPWQQQDDGGQQWEVSSQGGSERVHSKREIHIKGFSHQSVRAMVGYLYGGYVDRKLLDEHGVELFQLADEYQLVALRGYMAQFLTVTVHIGNALELARLADVHSLPLLLEACAHTITRNSDEILASGKWIKLRRDNKDLAIKLLELGYQTTRRTR